MGFFFFGRAATTDIADNAVTNAKLADNAVDNAEIADDAVRTAEIQDAAVTYAKIQDISASPRLLGRTTAGAGDIEEISAGTNITLSGGTISAASSGLARVAGDRLTVAASSMSFTGLSNDMYLVEMYLVAESGTPNAFLRVNNDSGNNYVNITLEGNGSTVSSGNFGGVVNAHGISDMNSNTELSASILVAKPVAGENGRIIGHGASANTIYVTSSKWTNAADKITRIDILPSTAVNLDVGSEVVIYGWDES